MLLKNKLLFISMLLLMLLLATLSLADVSINDLERIQQIKNEIINEMYKKGLTIELDNAINSFESHEIIIEIIKAEKLTGGN